MSKFDINSQSALAHAESFESIYKAIVECKTSLETISALLCASSSEYAVVAKEIKKIADDVGERGKSAKGLEKSLKEIVGVYNKCEQKVISGSDVSEQDNKSGDGQWENKYIRKFFELISSGYNKLKFGRYVKWIADRFNLGISNSFIGKKLINYITSDAELEKEGFGSIVEPVSKVLAFEYDEENDFYVTNENYGIQRMSGFANMYDDIGGALGMDLDTVPIEFTADGKAYRLQLWKGTYVFGNAYGSEIGLYENSSKSSGWYECAAGNDEVVTRQTLIDTKTGEEMTNYTGDYADNDDHFWNLMIKTDAGHKKEDLKQISYITFPSEECRNSFLRRVKYLESEANNGIEVELQKDGSVKIVY